MVLGHDFHSESGYQASLARGWEDAKQPTWHVLTWLLEGKTIALEDCFFTNFYMGLRAGSGTTGRFPGSTDPEFVERCQQFLKQQLALQRPRLVLTLGIWVPRLLAPLAPELEDWSTTRTFRDLDRSGPLRRDVSLFAGRCTVAALTHPSLWHVSVRHRRHDGLSGKAAELALLESAVAAAGYDRTRRKAS